MGRLLIDKFNDSRSYGSRRPPRRATYFHAGFLLGLFDPEDGGGMFLRNVVSLSMDYRTLYPRKTVLFSNFEVHLKDCFLF
jgi:hypothetical protein